MALEGNIGNEKTLVFKIICSFVLPDSGEVLQWKKMRKDIGFPKKTGIMIEEVVLTVLLREKTCVFLHPTIIISKTNYVLEKGDKCH